VPSEMAIKVVEDGADAERIDTLAGFLRQELLQLDVEDVTLAPGGDVPPGSRAFDAAAAGALLVSLGGSAAGIKDVVAVIRAWLARGGGVRRSVRIEIAGDVLELSEVSKPEQSRLVDLFVNRHAGS
jgi:hypothetical protein